MNIIVELTELEAAAMSLVVRDPQEWVENAVKARVLAASAEARQTSEWAPALASASQSGIDASDSDAVLMHGVSSGLLKTAAQREAEVLAAQPVLDPETNSQGIPDIITDRQFAQGLARRGLISKDEALEWVGPGTLPAAVTSFIEGLPADQQFDARMVLTGATAFKRSHPLTSMFGEVVGMDDAELDEFWLYCAGL